MNDWDIPGGFCNFDEHPAATAEREVFEELGLRIRVTGFLGIWMDTYGDATDSDGQEMTANAYYHAILASATGTVRTDASEIGQVGWFWPDESPADLAFPGHSTQVLDAWKGAVASGELETPMRDRPATDH